MMGRCPNCSEFGTIDPMVEEVRKEGSKNKRAVTGSNRATPQKLSEVDMKEQERLYVPMQEFARVLGGGLVPGSISLVGGEPGIGKCLTGDTRIFNPFTGEYRPITEFAEGQHHVLSVDDNGCISTDRVIAFHERGIRSIVEVTTRLGNRLRCTPEHPVLTEHGWKPISSLDIGSRLAAPCSLPYFGNDSLPQEEIKLIAYILRDGSAHSQIFSWAEWAYRANVSDGMLNWWRRGTIVPSQDELERLAKVAGLSIEEFAPETRDKADRIASIARYLDNIGLRYSTAADKAVPQCIFKLPREQLALFLKILFSCDGSIFISNGKSPGISYATISRQLAEDVKHFLLRFGLVAHICTKMQHVNQQAHTSYELQILGVSDVKLFLDEIGIYGREDGYPHDARLRALTYGDVYWDEIASMEPAGEEVVYDLSIENNPNFVANGLIVHNSTIILEIAALIANEHGNVLYVSGEESARQIKMRAERLAIQAESLYLLTETNLGNIFEHVYELNPVLLIIDSIQTTYTDDLDSSPGLVSQVRECATRLQGLAKSNGVTTFLIGHVTKEGTIAGPRVLEHIVDTVMYLEGDPFQTFRLLRSVKNRFGATSEVGVFEMAGSGMIEVPNPSEAFLAERVVNASGSAIAVTMEGTRPLLVEIQALTNPSAFGNARRTSNGVDYNRLLLLSAVLSKRVGLRLFEQDIFVNVIGGLKIDEPASDLATAIAIASSYYDAPVPADMAFIGEIGLSGELRTVTQLAMRLNEAAKIGFRKVVIPKMRRKVDDIPPELELIEVRNIAEALSRIMPKDK
jgi:DNA repair protein RadA/Sms